MNQKLTAKIRSGQGYTYLKLGGIIDEDNHLGGLTAQIAGPIVILDVADILRVNSYGVRDWVNWLDSLSRLGRQVVMVRCSSAVVGQANMVTNFTGQAIIVSFQAPYYCAHCDLSVVKVLSVEELLAKKRGPLAAPDHVCEVCGNTLEFDDFEESYFAFLQGVDPARITADIHRAIEQVSPEVEKMIRALDAEQINHLSGPLDTAAMRTPPSSGRTPASDAFPGLIRSASEAERAGIRATLPEPIRAMKGPAEGPATRPEMLLGRSASGGASSSSSMVAGRPTVRTASRSWPEGSASRSASNPPSSASQPGQDGELTSMLMRVLPYVLVLLALLVVGLLIVLVITIT